MADRKEPHEPTSQEEADFRSRLAEARQAHEEKHAERPGSTQGLALRVGSDFTAGIIVGGLLGWGIDRSFGTTPWGLIICLALGFVAGTNLAIRSAKEINERGAGGSGN
jgi:ATP synthase protein I